MCIAGRSLKGLLLVLLPLCMASAAIAGDPAAECQKSVTFAKATNGTLTYEPPSFSDRWFEKQRKKHPAICFAQKDKLTAREHYLVVLSLSSDYFRGLMPSYSQHTDTTTVPVSGTGTVTSSSGAMWNYTYTGTETLTTRTTTQTNLPYTDTTTTYYAYAYEANGALVANGSRNVTYRRGGDGYNTLGWNLGARLGSIHIREDLVEDILKKVSARPATVEVAPHKYTPEEEQLRKSLGMDQPPEQEAFRLMEGFRENIRQMQEFKDKPIALAVIESDKKYWIEVRDRYCKLVPKGAYTDLEGTTQSCSTLSK